MMYETCRKRLAERLHRPRYEHSLGVAETAGRLARMRRRRVWRAFSTITPASFPCRR